MSELKELYKRHYRERYRRYLDTQDPKYLNQDGLTEKEAQEIKEEVYREKCRESRNRAR